MRIRADLLRTQTVVAPISGEASLSNAVLTLADEEEISAVMVEEEVVRDDEDVADVAVDVVE